MHTILIATYIEYELFEKAFGMLCSPLLAQLIVTPSEFVVQEQLVGHDKASNGQHTTTKYTTVTSNCMFFLFKNLQNCNYNNLYNNQINKFYSN